MKKLLNKRLLMILSIILVLIGIPFTTFILKNQTVFKSRASNSQDPQNVTMTNISDKSFTVTYQTELPSTGSISYGDDKKLGESELEDLDKEKGSFSPKKIHSISVKKLMPSTKYYLTIISGSNTFLDNGAPFEITTGPDISSASAKETIIKGKIVLPNGNVPPEALVYLNTKNSQLLSSTIMKDGGFNFSLKELRTSDLSSYINLNDNAIFTIVATDGSLKSNTLASLSKIGSVPIITLSNDYNFIQEVSPIASRPAESLGFPSIAPLNGDSKPEIINPKENQSLTDLKPQFRGTSLPNEKVEIIIHSTEEITTQVTADNNGNWTYKPSANLSPGIHTITIKTRDSSGILTTIMRSFTVFAAETQTPTSIPSSLPTIIPIQKITPTSTPTLTPTLSPFPTITILAPLLTSTPIPSPIIAPIKSKGDLPPTGNSSALVIGIMGVTTTVIGLLMFLFIH